MLNNIVLAFLGLEAVIIGMLVRRVRRAISAERTLRKNDADFRHIVDQAPVMLWSARPDTTLHYLNHTCEDFTGLSLPALLDNGWLVAVHPDDVQGCIDTYLPAVEARESFVMEYRLRRADGIYRWVLDMGVPNFQADGALIGYVGAATDITERKNAEETIRESRLVLEGNHREIRHLAGRLITAHEDECRRLARELHDDLTQRLARLAIDAGQMEHTACTSEGLRQLREELVRLSEDVHALSYRLHPSVLDDLGLVEAIRAECGRVARQASLQVDLDACHVVRTLPGDTPLCLFRIAQEALSNAARHAHARTVSVHLATASGGLQLAIRDDGNGFDPCGPREHVSLGLASMRERVRLVHGDLEIESSPGGGTKVTAWVPA